MVSLSSNLAFIENILSEPDSHMAFINFGMVGPNMSQIDLTRLLQLCLAHPVGTARSVGIWASPTAVKISSLPKDNPKSPKKQNL